ncbi:hypothetical protein EHS25_004796 [Saitozyma podzolica]|uniref:Uncharacterized protein n=1 Tax=Saitozyma podzolica TaxID=1890683 RepID=A0A427Y2T3_9TREE|nr:hypothetical protein EHS25_004796 [Saitozyma podzolica]
MVAPHEYALPGDLLGEQGGTARLADRRAAKAVVEASSKLGRVWLTTIPFQPSLHLTDFEVAAALQRRTLSGEGEAHWTHCGEANFFGHPQRLSPEEAMAHGTTSPNASSDRPLAPPLALESDLNPSATRPAGAMTSRFSLGLARRPRD